MRLYGLLLGGFLCAAAAPPGFAAPLVCDAFRDRLNGALVASGDKDASVPAFKESASPPSGGKRYAWSSTGLSGTMSCGAAGQFEEFYVTLVFTDKNQFAEQMRHFITLEGASICSLVAGAAPACADAGKVLLQDALQQMGAAYNHGSNSPSGLSDRTLAANVKAELTSAPTLITFLIGPGRGGSLDEERQPLAVASNKVVQ